MPKRKRGEPALSWSLERFLREAVEIHGDKYDYSNVTEENASKGYNPVPITCRKCNYHWSPLLVSHINGKSGCPKCAGNFPWCYERFMTEAKLIHGQSIDYSQVLPSHITSLRSPIILVCNLQSCKHTWTSSVQN